MASGVLTNAQGSFSNLQTSLWQHIFTKIKTQYDAEASSRGLQSGLVLNTDGSYTADALGLGILDIDKDSDGIFKRVPCVGYGLDTVGGMRAPKSIGAGDGANWEYHKVILQCVPIVNVATDTYQTQSANRLAIMVLQTAVWNAVGRSFSFAIVDSTASRTNGLYPEIGYAEILSPNIPRRPAFKDALVIDRRDFNVEFDFRVAIQTFDGL